VDRAKTSPKLNVSDFESVTVIVWPTMQQLDLLLVIVMAVSAGVLAFYRHRRSLVKSIKISVSPTHAHIITTKPTQSAVVINGEKGTQLVITVIFPLNVFPPYVF
jgi:hypothetical protein